ncbi:MAG: hypothetical protein JW775_06660 [Candidatus Aminicenantes bacterium]|nr:hypothetical protein [Candidatus Aminicenantes bacterium]
MRNMKRAVVTALAFLLIISCGSPGSKVRPQGAGPAPALSATLSPDAAAWVDETLAGLTLEKKIAQIVTSDISGGYVADDDPRLLC